MAACDPHRPSVVSEDPEEILVLLDELARLASEHGARIEVESGDVSLAVTPSATATSAAAPPRRVERAAREDETQRVHASAVGIWGAAKDWSAGERITRGTVFGAIQSLGHIAEVTAPADGEITEVLVAGGAPVEYGQPLFAIALR